MLWHPRNAGNTKNSAGPNHRAGDHASLTACRVLLATVDHEIRNSIAAHLQEYSIKAVCVKAIEEVRAALAREPFAACFSGFWLVDGTYRDVFRQLKRQALESPMVLVCGPACPSEYRDYLASLKIRAFDFISHPYRKSDLERILRPIIGASDSPQRTASMPEAGGWEFPGRQRFPIKA